MIHICICDDSDAMRDELCGLIQALCQKHSIAASVSCCSSGEELLFDPDDKNRTTDIFFLDILMKKLNGIETAARLRAITPTAQIIFLTVSKEHVFEALDVMPLHYLLKQDMRTEKIEKVFLKAISLAEKGRKEKFTYKFGKTIGSLLLSDIIYFEVKNRIIEIHTKTGPPIEFYIEKVFLKAISLAEKGRKEKFTYKFGKTIGSLLLSDIIYFEVKNRIIEIHTKTGPPIEFYGNISDLEQQLPPESFHRVHRSYIVNFENVDYLSGKEFVCIDRTVIPIGQKYADSREHDSREHYQNFLLNGLSMV